jgi:hypothetical protein
MAKKKMSTACEPEIDRDWRARDDAHDLMRMSELSRKPERASRAQEVLREALSLATRFARRGDKKRSKSRGGSRG